MRHLSVIIVNNKKKNTVGTCGSLCRYTGGARVSAKTYD